jgi:predicted alpha/beta superfamily hydrolase
MKKIIITALTLLTCICSSAQGIETINIGKKESINSAILKESRKLWIYVPEITNQYTDSNKRYPVLYVLDGEAHFYSTVGIVQQLSQANGNGVLPEMIIVGIGTTNRLRDLTPAVPSKEKELNESPFTKFLSTELIPFIDKNYKTTPYRLLAGHSLGGLTAINILTNFPKLFNACIAIDPSMWYSNEIYLSNAMTQLSKQDFKGSQLFMGIANTMPEGMSISKLNKDTTIETQHIRSIFKFSKFQNSNKNGLKFSDKFYEKENHNSVPLLAIYDGLRFIFDYYHLNATEKDFNDSSALIAAKLKMHYTQVSEKMGYKNSPPEALINYFVMDALNKKYLTKAEALLKFNLENYPNSNNTYDIYGYLFLMKKDTANAILSYQKSLQIKNNPITVSKLNTLTKQTAFLLAPEDLKKYEGTYILDTYKIAVVIKIREGKLWSTISGQPDNEFIPLSKDVFTVKDKQGYTITFDMKNEKATNFTSVQPNGTFRATITNE